MTSLRLPVSDSDNDDDYDDEEDDEEEERKSSHEKRVTFSTTQDNSKNNGQQAEKFTQKTHRHQQQQRETNANKTKRRRKRRRKRDGGGGKSTFANKLARRATTAGDNNREYPIVLRDAALAGSHSATFRGIDAVVMYATLFRRLMSRRRLTVVGVPVVVSDLAPNHVHLHIQVSKDLSLCTHIYIYTHSLMSSRYPRRTLVLFESLISHRNPVPNPDGLPPAPLKPRSLSINQIKQIDGFWQDPFINRRQSRAGSFDPPSVLGHPSSPSTAFDLRLRSQSMAGRQRRLSSSFKPHTDLTSIAPSSSTVSPSGVGNVGHRRRRSKVKRPSVLDTIDSLMAGSSLSSSDSRSNSKSSNHLMVNSSSVAAAAAAAVDAVERQRQRRREESERERENTQGQGGREVSNNSEERETAEKEKRAGTTMSDKGNGGNVSFSPSLMKGVVEESKGAGASKSEVVNALSLRLVSETDTQTKHGERERESGGERKRKRRRSSARDRRLSGSIRRRRGSSGVDEPRIYRHISQSHGFHVSLPAIVVMEFDARGGNKAGLRSLSACNLFLFVLCFGYLHPNLSIHLFIPSDLILPPIYLSIYPSIY